MFAHWFWGLLTIACLAWYSSVTFYIAVKGLLDIKTMLAHLKAAQTEDLK